jgi:hypothetical protein
MPTKDYILPFKIDDMIKDLDKIFPLKNPNIKDSEREIFYKAGQRSVIEFLKQKYKETI